MTDCDKSSFDLGCRQYRHAKIPSVAIPNGDKPSYSSAATLSELYVEIRKGQVFFLYIFVHFRHFANINKTSGTLGGSIALMTWLYLDRVCHASRSGT